MLEDGDGGVKFLCLIALAADGCTECINDVFCHAIFLSEFILFLNHTVP
jgi:hypothetical protein